jgi:adenylylsulfate kinase-like enzyme
VTYVARPLVGNGVVPIFALISPYASSRARAREQISRVTEVYVATPIVLCEQRDVIGVYRKARQGLHREMTGVDDPYEVPASSEVTVKTVDRSCPECAEYVLSEIERLGWLPAG